MLPSCVKMSRDNPICGCGNPKQAPYYFSCHNCTITPNWNWHESRGEIEALVDSRPSNEARVWFYEEVAKRLEEYAAYLNWECSELTKKLGYAK